MQKKGAASRRKKAAAVASRAHKCVHFATRGLCQTAGSFLLDSPSSRPEKGAEMVNGLDVPSL